MHEIFANSPMLGAGHHVRAETNTPIIGILMQPIPEPKDGNSERWQKEFERLQFQSHQEALKAQPHTKLDQIFPKKMYVESSHVKYLEAAGARVIPIDMNMKDEKLEELLK
jgi:hypothetical protein